MARATDPDAPEASPRRRLSPRALGLLAAVALVAYGVDQITKYLVTSTLEINDVVPLLGEVLQLHYVTNPGAAFSLATGFTWILSIVAVGVIVFIVWFAPRIRSLGWATMFGLVLGGAFGNVTDRLTRPPGFGVGHVVDFIQVWGFPAIFNFADVAVVSAMGLFLILSLRNVGLDGTRHTEAPKSDAAATADD
ncbi:signal peptidase II [Pseudolysinimonas sp.]|uniref:signal peptidase II n=1 Tax=Pseudolysinimonas sp. TaxID=2680009 RepID=UPI00378506D6